MKWRVAFLVRWNDRATERKHQAEHGPADVAIPDGACQEPKRHERTGSFSTSPLPQWASSSVSLGTAVPEYGISCVPVSRYVE